MKMAALIAILVCALLFVLTWSYPLQMGRYTNVVRIGAQVGMGIALIIFFIIPGKKRASRQPPGNS